MRTCGNFIRFLLVVITGYNLRNWTVRSIHRQRKTKLTTLTFNTFCPNLPLWARLLISKHTVPNLRLHNYNSLNRLPDEIYWTILAILRRHPDSSIIDWNNINHYFHRLKLMLIWPPSPVNLIALSSKLPKTCLSFRFVAKNLRIVIFNIPKIV